MKKVLALLLALTMIISLTACKTDSKSQEKNNPTPANKEAVTTSPEEVVTINFWSFHTGAEGEFLANAVKLFNETHDNIKVEQTVANQSDYITTLIPTAYANGEAPDVFYVEPSTFTKYASKGMLADLSSYYSDKLKADILPSALEAASLDGKIYALPMEMETLGLFYNVDMLKNAGINPPTTWEELYSAAKALTTEDVYGLVLPVEDSGYTLFNWWPFMWMNGADVLSTDRSKCVVNSPEMVQALDFWGSFFREGLSPSSLQIGPWDIGNIGTGVAAMQVSGTYVINAAETTYGDVNIGVVPLPAPEGKKSVTVAGGQKLAANAQSKNIDAAAEFIFWLYGNTEDTSLASKWVTEAKFAYPARQSVIDANSEIYTKGLRKDFTDFYNTAVPEPSYSAEISDILSDTLQSVMFGGISGEEAAAQAQKDIDLTLQ